jgi:CO/xanthine dehydrogenase Mo-binding subunit
MGKRTSFSAGRRHFLKTAIVSGSLITVCCHLNLNEHPCEAKPQKKTPPKTDAFVPNAWVSIARDNSITVKVNHSEMGQGIITALSMIVADELDADWRTINAHIAPAQSVYKNPEFHVQMTASSTSVKSSWEPLRQASAVARQMLITAAAAKWQVSDADCYTRNGMVIHEKNGHACRYGELVDAAVHLPPIESVAMKTPAQYRIIGTSMPRMDTPSKVTGRAVFGIDVTLPGLLQATVVHPPAFGARLKAVDDSLARQSPGVRDVLEIASGIAVVADTFWQARTAAETLVLNWQQDPEQEMTSSVIQARWATLMEKKARRMFSQGKPKKQLKKTSKTIQAVYTLPFQGHATPEPMNCAADVKKDSCEIWAPTQNQDAVQEVAARITGLGYEHIAVHTTFIGGGFGRRICVDYAAEAVEISKAINAPVKVIWTREEDMQNDFFRPAVAAKLVAGLDHQGLPSVWHHRIVGPDHMAHQLPDLLLSIMPYGVPRMLRSSVGALAKAMLPRLISGKKAAEGAAPLPYAIDHVCVEYVRDDPGIPLGFWRSVAFSQNIFFIESFIDEIAHATGQDPLALRCTLLRNAPRMLRVVQRVGKASGWPHGAVKDAYLGLAAYHFQGTNLAMVAEILIDAQSRIRVPRVVCAVDCGIVIHPRIVEDQIASGIVFGMTAALKSRITLTNGVVDQRNLNDFPLLRMDEMPEVNVHIVQSNQPPSGIGESAVPGIGPALANAVFAATGKRIRHLPISATDLSG